MVLFFTKVQETSENVTRVKKRVLLASLLLDLACNANYMNYIDMNIIKQD